MSQQEKNNFGNSPSLFKAIFVNSFCLDYKRSYDPKIDKVLVN